MSNIKNQLLPNVIGGSIDSVGKLSDFQTFAVLLSFCFICNIASNMIFDRSTEHTTKNGEIQKNIISIKPLTE